MAVALKYIIETNLIRVRYVVLYKLLQDGTLIVIKVGVLYVGVIHMSRHLKKSWLGLQISGFRLLVI